METIFDISARQHAVFTLDQARECGWSDDDVFHRRRSGLIVPIHAAVYRLAGAPRTWHQRAMAATLAGGDPVRLSHGASAALWGLAGCPMSRIEVAIPYEHDYNAEGVIAHRSRHYRSPDTERRLGIPVSSVTRTIVDLAAHKTPKQMFDIMDDTFLRRLSSPERIHALLEEIRGRGRSGTRLLRTLLQDYAPGTKVPRSTFERQFFMVIDAAGIRRPRRNATVTTRMGSIEVDLLWDPEMLVVEADSRRFHDTVVQVEDDSERRRALTAAGCAVMPVRYAALKYRPQEVVGDIREALAARRHRVA